MAKKNHKKHQPKKKRVSGVGAVRMPKGKLMNTLFEAAGLLGAATLNKAAQNRLTRISPKMLAGGQIVVGAVLVSKTKHPFLRGVGYGTLSVGVLGLAREMHMISGVEDMLGALDGEEMGDTYFQRELMSGLDSNAYMSGLNSNAYVSGAGGGNEIVEEML